MTKALLEQSELDALVEAVRSTARSEIMPRFRNLEADDIATKTGDEDLVTVADREAERVFTEAARTILPGAAVVGEEAVSDDPSVLEHISQSEVSIIIDPIDGTANFAADLPVFGVILAVLVRGQTEFGVLYDPVMDDWVMARRETGAWFCRPDGTRRQLRVGAEKAINRTRGFLSPHLFPSANRPAIAQEFGSFGLVRNLRCSCHEYRTMAFGHADFLLAAHPNSWDHAAGALIVHEAGGIVQMNGSDPYKPAERDGTLVAAGWPSLANEVQSSMWRAFSPV